MALSLCKELCPSRLNGLIMKMRNHPVNARSRCKKPHISSSIYNQIHRKRTRLSTAHVPPSLKSTKFLLSSETTSDTRWQASRLEHRRPLPEDKTQTSSSRVLLASLMLSAALGCCT